MRPAKPLAGWQFFGAIEMALATFSSYLGVTNSHINHVKTLVYVIQMATTDLLKTYFAVQSESFPKDAKHTYVTLCVGQAAGNYTLRN